LLKENGSQAKITKRIWIYSFDKTLKITSYEMASITSTIKLATTSLFPTPVNFTLPVVETVALDAAFSTVVVAEDDAATVYSTAAAVGSSKVVYFYLQAPSTNPADGILVTLDDGTNAAQVLKLVPGDFAWFPVYANASGVEVVLTNPNLSTPATVNYFYGEKG
jgi:hypothetical protein